MSEDELQLLVPSKAGEVDQVKVAAPSRTVIFTMDGQPIFIDTSGKGDWVPAVFSLWKVECYTQRHTSAATAP